MWGQPNLFQPFFDPEGQTQPDSTRKMDQPDRVNQKIGSGLVQKWGHAKAASWEEEGMDGRDIASSWGEAGSYPNGPTIHPHIYTENAL